MSYLRAVGEVSDQGGLASTALAEAVGYPGSSLAFAQLLSAMERSGLIEREVRGRRTYRITLAPAAAAPARDREPGASGWPADQADQADQAEPADLTRPTVPGVSARPAAPRAAVAREAGRQAAPRGGTGVPEPGPEPGAIVGLDYDELARRLLIEVVHRLAAAPGNPPRGNTAPGSGLAPDAERSLAEREPGLRLAQDYGDLAWASEPAWVGDLARNVVSLERKLASVEAQQRALRAENTRLREQLAATRQSLAEQSLTAAPDTGAYLNRLDTGAVQLLERLLASLRTEAGRGDAARGQSAEVG
jgi:hypothetical protein